MSLKFIRICYINYINYRLFISELHVLYIFCMIKSILQIFSYKSGIYWWQIIDWYAFSMAVILIAIFECIIFSYIYGLKRFCSNIEEMTGSKPNYFWRLCWAFLTPLILLVFCFNIHILVF